MTRLLVALIFVLVSSQVFAMNSLSDLTWKKRVIIVFADAGDKRLERQVKILTDQRPELEERDLVVISVVNEEASIAFGNVAELAAAELRDEAGVKKGSFQVILVGKDGGIKLRSDTVVPEVELFDVIDRMPMRQAERG
ncbi:DUF4174 domain-containing protein [Agrobacterium cavarae]|uniref:DUF4174 domain-containing protein n=1 Tax=Agrobacterium cavarae TaxID=2528239 RepID=UPI002785B1D7|nr:hypothetical protein [Agrobacterium larrymoorei]